MPKNWLASKLAPDPPVLDWLKWTAHDLERHTISGTVAAIIGLNKMGDLQTIFSPIIIQNAFNNGEHSAIIGNSSNKNGNDTGSIAACYVVEQISKQTKSKKDKPAFTVANPATLSSSA